ncbi:hypothetical protein ACRALDRAFT_1066442, partial [Sodiomyces alcalophilus JCM 7366]|uniref:uncharacterized protein n=1 Tax=Sodiomyces alcalophilus JCM 7366 TaxID=591952 RepID=UPI0039B5FAE9
MPRKSDLVYTTLTRFSTILGGIVLRAYTKRIPRIELYRLSRPRIESTKFEELTLAVLFAYRRTNLCNGGRLRHDSSLYPYKAKIDIYIPFNLKRFPFIICLARGEHTHTPPPPSQVPQRLRQQLLLSLSEIPDISALTARVTREFAYEQDYPPEKRWIR